MALPENLLSPIPGENPSGQNLRYDPVYDKIKEARREEEELPSGDQGTWASEIKKADWPLVQKLAVEALEKKGKDLQIAAWLTEALLSRESFVGLQDGLALLRGLVENFWDTLQPGLEDGELDLELRAAPIEWVGTFLEGRVRKTPLTKSGYDWFKHKESRGVGYEADVEGNEAKTEARQAKLAEGKLAPEIFDADVEVTRVEFYQKLQQGIDGSLGNLESLKELCDQKFGSEYSPAFGKLREALEEVQRVVNGILKKKLPPEEAAAGEEYPAEEVPTEEGGAARPARRLVAEEPADRDDAVRRIVGVAKYWRREEPGSPVPFLLLRGLRWGELRAAGTSPDMTLFEAPPTELRQNIKRASLESNWAEVLEAAETAMGLTAGRAWLDLQRYVVRAATELGYEAIATAVTAELRGLLADYPQLPDWTLMDDTPTANPETRQWLNSLPAAGAQASAVPSVASMDETAPAQPGEEKPPDVYEQAQEAMQSGRARDAIEMLARAIAGERSGRAQFHRMVQLASICLNSGHENLAYPILREIVEMIEQRKLEEWESREVIAQPLALYYRCLDRLNHPAEIKQAIYERLCRLDPMQALAVLR